MSRLRYPALAVLLLRYEPEPLVASIVEGRPPAALRLRLALGAIGGRP